jgi:hypothetical protein
MAAGEAVEKAAEIHVLSRFLAQAERLLRRNWPKIARDIEAVKAALLSLPLHAKDAKRPGRQPECKAGAAAAGQQVALLDDSA